MNLKRILVILGSLSVCIALYFTIRTTVPKMLPAKVNYWGSSKITGVNVYTSMNTASSVLAVLNKIGVPFYVYTCDKQWCHIELLNGMKGYVKPTCVSRQLTSIVQTKADVYNLPEGKKILATLYPNVLVQSMHRNGNWCFVNKNTLRGYVRCDKLIGGYGLLH